MNLENVKSAFGDKRTPSAKKTQDSAIINMIKEVTLKHIFSNINGNQRINIPFPISEPNKVYTRMQAAKESNKNQTTVQESTIYYEIRNQEQLRKDFEALAYPCHDEDEVPVICEGCWKFQSEKHDGSLIKCMACKAYLHRECQGINDTREDQQKYFTNGFCLRCFTILTKDYPCNSIKCVFCPLLTGIIVPFYGEFWGHLLCIQYFKLFYHLDKKKNVILLNKQLQEVIENDIVCYACKNKNGFSVQCNKTTCTLKIHISCGLRKGLINPFEIQESLNNNSSKFLTIQFLCAEHCSEKIKSSFLRQRFSNMASINPRKNSLNHNITPFLSKESLVALRIFSRSTSPISKSEVETQPQTSDLLILKKNFCRVLNISQSLVFQDIEKLRRTILDFFKEKGVLEIYPIRGINFAKCTNFFPPLKGLKSSFVTQKNLWKALEKNIFEKTSYQKLIKFRSKKPKTRLLTRNISPLPLYTSEGQNKDPIQRSIDRLRNYSPSPPGNRKTISPRQNKKNQDSIRKSLESLHKYSPSPPKTSLSRPQRKYNKRPRFSPKISQSRSQSLAISRSRSRSKSKARKQENEQLGKKGNLKKMAAPTFIKISDLLNNNLPKDPIEKINDFMEPEHEIDSSPQVSENELNIRRQINEDKVRKLIARIDAPGYSIDRNITYFKDIENVAHRDDVFDDLMGDLFNKQEGTSQEANNEGNVPQEEPTNGPTVIVVQEEEEKEKKKVDILPKEKLPAFEFAKKDEPETEEWLEKRWCLSKRPFQSRHIINSVALNCLENPYNEKDLGNIGRHFYDLKLV